MEVTAPELRKSGGKKNLYNFGIFITLDPNTLLLSSVSTILCKETLQFLLSYWTNKVTFYCYKWL